MTIYAIPCAPDDISNFKQKTQLDGVDYVLEFVWNQRDGHWLMHLLDQDEDPIMQGILLVTNYDLIKQCIDPRRPPGMLFIADALGLDEDPGYSDLGGRFTLGYVSAT